MNQILSFVLVFAFIPAIICNGITSDNVTESNAFPHVKQEDLSTFTQLLNNIDQSPVVTIKQEEIGLTNFSCQTFGPSSPKPTSVHKLRVSDIDVVAAIGDSLTAGFGANSKTILTLFTEYRGVSFSIGGDATVESVVTFPNIIKKYNPNVKGFSVGKGKETSAGANLNAAVSGAIAQNMLSQVNVVLDKLKKDPAYKFESSWKVITIFIGANNLCDVCDDYEKHSPAKYSQAIEDALDRIKATIPRVFVSLVPSVDVTRLGDLSKGFCSLLHPFECGCAVNAKKLNITKQAFSDYFTALNELAKKDKYHDKEDFTVVIQPFYYDTDVPRTPKGQPDSSYFAPDCFHFSGKAHAAAAIGLFNNLVQKVGKKELKWHIGEEVSCPNSIDYLWTIKNSGTNK